MSEWYDADGEPLGHWEPCTEDEYMAAWLPLRDEPECAVFASYTKVGREGVNEAGELVWYGRTIYTEWGRSGDDSPLIRCDDRWDAWGDRDHSHARFVLREAAQ